MYICQNRKFSGVDSIPNLIQMTKFISMSVLLAGILLFTSGRPIKTYDELYRPQFHFSPEKNWMNDPDGLVFYDGEYHLFYQYNPNGNEWGYMHWGHAVSTDLVHWKNLPIAIYPDNNSTDKVNCTAWSGSAIVDKNNVTGLQEGNYKTLLAFYTSRGCGQRMAYSNDKGRTWKKYAGNPIIPEASGEETRDPKVFWYEPGKNWVMVLYRMPDADKSKEGISIYNSTDLVHWTFESHITGYYECPDLFALPLDGDSTKMKWALLGGDGSYLVGAFDGKQFTPETGKRVLDYGQNFYATQTWSNAPNGKRIQIAWMRESKYPGMPFTGQMSFPTELSLKSTPNGPRIFRTPVEEISSLYGKKMEKTEKNIIPGLKNNNLLSGMHSEAFRITAVLDVKTSNTFGITVRKSRKDAGTEISYNVKNHILTCINSQMPLVPVNNKIKLDILVDRASIEIFANNGERVITDNFTPAEKADEMELWTRGGEIMVDSLSVHEIKSIWKE